jgi:hypothetical protein
VGGAPTLGDAGPQGAPKEDTNISSAEMVYGLPLILPEQLVFFPLFFLCSKEHFYIFFVQYLGVTVGI